MGERLLIPKLQFVTIDRRMSSRYVRPAWRDGLLDDRTFLNL
ncbi:MAG TPA: hypothetical protein PLP19_12575 [bacterium]|nr:hypothetical protein [bacterium]HPN44319.1 hypothetical protein [bacterium]